ncbi:MAG: YidC/Oxa1 family membrane protein insertase [Acidimicrobiales bacterium]
MFDFLAALLSFFYETWTGPSRFGVAVILLTIVVFSVVTPLTFKQTKSMIAMQRLQPEIKALQSKHKDDRERLNQEMMALYQANGVNPLGGCLPILVQMPIFLVMYQIIRGITRRITETGLAIGSSGYVAGVNEVAGGQAVGFEPVPLDDFVSRKFNPAYLSEGSDLRQALEVRNDMPSFGIDLSRSARNVLSDGIVTAWPYLLLIAIVLATSVVQQRQIRGRRKSSAAAANPTQDMIMKVMPFMLPVFSFNFVAALVMYFVVSNLIRVGQQAVITRQFYGEDGEEIPVIVPESTGPTTITKKKKPSTNSGRASSGGGAHGSRRPTSRPARKRRSNDPAATESSKASGTKPVKPTKNSSGRITPKKDK